MVIKAIEEQLTYQTSQETRNRKKLRPNALAEWELRVRHFRIFYDVDVERSLVKIEAIGYKEGGALFLHGEEFKL